MGSGPPLNSASKAGFTRGIQAFIPQSLVSKVVEKRKFITHYEEDELNLVFFDINKNLRIRSIRLPAIEFARWQSRAGRFVLNSTISYTFYSIYPQKVDKLVRKQLEFQK